MNGIESIVSIFYVLPKISWLLDIRFWLLLLLSISLFLYLFIIFIDSINIPEKKSFISSFESFQFWPVNLDGNKIWEANWNNPMNIRKLKYSPYKLQSYRFAPFSNRKVNFHNLEAYSGIPTILAHPSIV